MKKIISGLLLVTLICFGLSACGKKNIQDTLTDTKWNVVSSNGEAYTGEFNDKTVSFTLGSLSQGFSYKITKEKGTEVIIMTQEDKTIKFAIEKKDKDLIFKSKNEKTKEQYGDMTLSPIK